MGSTVVPSHVATDLRLCIRPTSSHSPLGASAPLPLPLVARASAALPSGSPRLSFKLTHQRTLRPTHARRTFSPRATADPAASVEESVETPVAEEKEVPTPEEGVAEAKGSPGGVLQALRDAVESGEAAALAAVEAEVKALQTDRDSLVLTLASLEQEIGKGKDRFLRLNADFDNFRKRSEREKQSLASMVRGEVIEALLPMVDSFERAKTSLKLETEGEQRIDSAYQGIYKQFVEVMKALGVAAVETVGKEFNPEVHEAIMREESLEYPEGVVIQEFRKGFVIGDRLLRAAMVKVSSGPGPSEPVDASAEEAPASDGEISAEE